MSAYDQTMLSVEDLAKSLNISKAAVYKSVKKNKELEKPIIKSNGQTFISFEGVNYLKSLYPITMISTDKIDDSIDSEVSLAETEIAATSISSKSSSALKTSPEIAFSTNSESEYEYDNETEKIVNFMCKNNSNLSNIENTSTSKNDTDSQSATSQRIIKEVNPNSNLNVTKPTFVQPEQTANNTDSNMKLTEEMVSLLKSYVDFLQNECDVKNKQLDSKDDVIKNMQSLLEKEQETVATQVNLEDRCKEIDSKLMDLRSQLNTRKSKNKEGFFKRLFNAFK